MRVVGWILVLLLLIGLVLAVPPSPPAEPTLSPDDCSWTPTVEICDSIDNNCNGLVDDGLDCDASPASPNGGGGGSFSMPPTNDPLVNDSLPDTSQPLTKIERKAAETKEILDDMNLSEIPNFTENPVQSVTFWTRKVFIYGGIGLFLVIVGIIALVFYIEKKRTKAIAKQDIEVLKYHDTLRASAKQPKTKTPHEKAREYVTHMREKKFSDAVIKENLKKSGWSETQLKTVFGSDTKK